MVAIGLVAADWPIVLRFYLDLLIGAYSTRKIVICSLDVGVDYCRVVVLCFGRAR